MKNLRRILMEPSSSMPKGRESQRSHRRRRTLSPPTLKTRIPRKVTSTYCGPEERESLSTQLIRPPALAEALSVQFKKRTQLRLILPLMIPSRQLHQTGLSFSRSSRKKSLTASLILSYSVTITVLATRQKWLERLGTEQDLKTLPVQLGATVLFAAFVRNMLL
uniref:Uncharacterized protein n=1 Tax=Cherry green ring mottle virus TaxID=65467 RepID=A0A290D6J1_9VIRU|nr:hypothetical protein [Cherry green ring mottle virus]ATB18090.1 hypothetical protein [Cherry green ring mottle virus]